MSSINQRWKHSLIASAVALALAPALLAAPFSTPSATAAAEPALVTDPASYVNTLNGTGSGGESVGSINNFPGPATPFGMVQYSPDTVGNYAGYFHGNTTLKGFSMTHASVGCTAFGDIPALPTTGDVGSKPWEKTATIDSGSELGTPGQYSVTLSDTGVKADLSASTRTGVATYAYPQGAPAQLFVRPGASIAGNSAASLQTLDDHTVVGSATTGNFCGKGNRYTVYFAMSFDQAFTATGTWDESSISAGSRSVNNSRAGAFYTFPAGSTVKVKTALSYVSTDAAQANMAAEVPGYDFDTVRSQTKAAWNSALGTISVAGKNTDDLHTFYTSLYRSLLHPNTFNDADGKYIGFDNQIHSVEAGRTQYANFSDWDTYRSLAPLHGLFFPKQASDMAQSLVNDAVQSGSYPRWALANSATGQMTGDSVVALISNLYAFGARDFDTATALKYMVKGATDGGTGLNGYVERPGIERYLKNKYAPQTAEFQADHTIAGASITLEWSIDDFAIARFARALGNNDTAAQFQERSHYWQNLFNPSTGYISPRSESGQFPDGPGYQAPPPGKFGQAGFDEGNAAQYLWLVPQNADGLATALGGRAQAAERLDTFMTKLNVGANDPYMWAGNEPNFQTPWMYNYFGQPWKTQKVVDDIRTSLFGNTVNGEPGNDDLGAQSSWYVWAALGIYPTTPGTNLLTVNTPAFDKSVLTLPQGKLTLNAAGATDGKRYIAGLSVNGTATQNTSLPESILGGSSTVDFTLQNSPDQSWGTSAQSAPPSFGDGQKSLTANAAPALLTVRPGAKAEVSVDAQRMAGSAKAVTVSVQGKDGLSIGDGGSSTFASDGSAHLKLPLVASAQLAEGYYPVSVTVSDGTTSVATAVTVRVVQANTVADAANIIGTASAAYAGGANFDTAGNSYSREQLAGAGLAPGQKATVGDLSFAWPNAPEGYPDTVAPDGQTIAFGPSTTKLAFVGAAINGGAQATGKATLDDGTQVDVPIQLGDWVLPSSNGDPLYGNRVVAKMSKRNAVSDVPGAYVYATAEFTAPSGRTIASVTLPSSSGDGARLRLFAIANNSVAAPTTTTTTLTATATQTNRTTSVALSATVAPGSATGTVQFLDGDTVVAETPLGNGSAQATVNTNVTGDHVYRARFVPEDATQFASSTSEATTITVNGAPTQSPSITLSSNAVQAGTQVSVTGANFSPSSSVSITLHSDPVLLATVNTDSNGAFTSTVTIPANIPVGNHSMVASGAGVSATQPISILAASTGPTGGSSSPGSSASSSAGSNSSGAGGTDSATSGTGSSAAGGSQSGSGAAEAPGLASTGAGGTTLLVGVGLVVLLVGSAAVAFARHRRRGVSDN